jgi:hypothetical protein
MSMNTTNGVNKTPFVFYFSSEDDAAKRCQAHSFFCHNGNADDVSAEVITEYFPDVLFQTPKERHYWQYNLVYFAILFHCG